MPEISRFFGIVISMYYNDHTPPHFHARYAGKEVVMEIGALAVLDGEIGPRALGLVTEWAKVYRHELEANWDRARQQKPLQRISPLE